jgi:hypothetical protein
MPGILREDEKTRLPRGVTTASGNYTAGTPITSRSAQGSVPVGPSRVDFSSTPRLQRVGQELSSIALGGASQSASPKKATTLVAPPVASSKTGQPGISIIPAAEAKTATTSVASTPTRPTTPGFAARHFSANQPSGAPAKDVLPGVGETENVYNLPGINRYNDASGVPTFTNKGRAGYDELQAQGGASATGVPQISQASLDDTLATSPVFTSMVPSAGGGRVDAVSAGIAKQGVAEDQAVAEATEARQTAERRILKRLPGLPAAQVPGALASLAAGETARRGKPVTLDQIKAASAQQLLASGREPTASQNLLFGKNPPALGKPQLIQMDGPVGEDGFPGPKELFAVDPVTGQGSKVDLSGGQPQAQAPRPSLAAFLAAARKDPRNAQVSDADLTKHYRQNYAR